MPLKAELQKFSIRGSVVESAANTFTSAQVDLNLSLLGSHVFMATALQITHNAALTGAGDQLDVQLTYTTQTGIVDANDADFFWGLRNIVALTTSGAFIRDQSPRFVWTGGGFPIGVQNLQLAVQGTNLGTAVTVGLKLEGYLQRVTTSEFYRITQQR